MPQPDDRLFAALDPCAAAVCRAVSQPGTPVTCYTAGWAVVAITGPGRDFICTQDPGHEGGHAACDGEGRILARWPRKDTEHYWHPGDCKGHGHGQ